MENSSDSPAHDRNPSPPPELRQNKELDLADNVGQSAFSKHWIFSTLMKLIQEVDSESEKLEADLCELGIDVSEDLQNELCELWDMSMNKDVAEFLHEFKAMDILGGVIRKSKAPRVVEICVGILGNMVCCDKVCIAISNNSVLVEVLLALMDSRDPQTLVETFRLCYVCLCNSSVSDIWLKAVKDRLDSQTNIKFLLQSSTNGDLLKKTAYFLDKLLELDDDLCCEWATQEMVQALLEGVHQIGYSQSEELEVFLHVFELISTTETGVEALVSEYEKAEVPLKKYLAGVCEYEIVGLEGQERSLCSSLAVLNVIFSASTDIANSIIQDKQNMRYLLKILEPLSSRIQQIKVPHSADDNCVKEQKSSSSENDEPTLAPKETTSETNGNPGSGEPADHDKEGTEKHSPQEKEDKTTSDNTDTDNKYFLLLFEIIQGLLQDIVCYLHSIMPEQVADEGEITVPPVLMYLNKMCSRERVKCLITALEEATDPDSEDETDSVVMLSNLAQRYKLRRLSDIIDNVPWKSDTVRKSESGP
ncbi:protein saal1-like [Liolophura sinensis]|uniref:protein saal1-like n=1 Tax=Liolophura sinensis TaxID=3198878 RepID=UPI0031598F01